MHRHFAYLQILPIYLIEFGHTIIEIVKNYSCGSIVDTKYLSVKVLKVFKAYK